MQKVLYFLGELSDSDLDWLIQVGEKRDISSGTVLIREGRPVDTLYIMLDGTLVVSVAAMGGRELARLHSGDIVGEMSFVESRPPSATVQTLEKSVVLAIPRAVLADKLNQDVAFASRFYKALAILLSSRLRGTVKQLGYSQPSTSSSPSETNGTEVEHTETLAIAEARFSQLMQQLGVDLSNSR